MLPQDLKTGAAYYRLTYADPGLTVSAVKPMIYVGTNIFPEDDPGSVVHYFQDTISDAWRGSVTPSYASTHPEIEGAVYPHTEVDFPDRVLKLSGVIAALMAAEKRGVLL